MVPAITKRRIAMRAASLMVSFYERDCGGDRDPDATAYFDFNMGDEWSKEDAYWDARTEIDEVMKSGKYVYADVCVETVLLDDKTGERIDDPDYSDVVMYFGSWLRAGFVDEPPEMDENILWAKF